MMRALAAAAAALAAAATSQAAVVGRATGDVTVAGAPAGVLTLACRNAATGERGSVALDAVRRGPGGRVTFAAADAWPRLPYPVARTAIPSKPAAIIEQQTHRSPFGFSQRELRRRFASVASYMLETAGHRYDLPLGDGRLECALRGSDGASRRFAVDFGRGLPPGPYARDRSLPDTSAWPLWGLDGGVPAVPPPPADVSRELRGLARAAPASASALRAADDGTPVAAWIEATLDVIATTAGIDPPHAARALALVSVAAYDASVLAARAARRYHRAPPCRLDRRVHAVAPCTGTPSYPSQESAVAAAAQRVLADLFPAARARFAGLARRQAGAVLRAGWALPSDLAAGEALGRAVGDRLVARAREDGSGAVWTGAVAHGKGKWVPTPPAFDPEPAGALVGTWRPWSIASAAALLPSPPPAPGSAAYARDVRAVYAIGHPLSIEHQEVASAWEDKAGSFTPPGHWNAIALRLVREAGLSTPRAALVFAALGTAQADAFIACWNAKYTYWTQRPVTAIRASLDPDWSPYVYTPSFPSYPSGHSTTSAAAAAVLGRFFPAQAARLAAMAGEAGISRIYGGIHFPSDNRAGLALGRRVAAATLAQLPTITRTAQR